MKTEFVTCLNCIDGRVQLPVINWIITNHGVKYVDMITVPGIDGLIAENSNIKEILERMEISKDVHSTNQIFIVGHHDCLANPVDDEVHMKQVVDAAKYIKKLDESCDVIGLWVDNNWKVHAIYSA